ncbi:MAG TPA: type II secretion system secretin GspD [Gammaproteobacteria bacterium]|nr:type II secretion system secretin GspD [Gammaproteobacteria bacterium]
MSTPVATFPRSRALALALFVALSPLAIAQEIAPPPDAAAPAAPASEEHSLTLNFKDADIRAFISAVADLTHQNFVVDPRVQGRVTVISSAPTDPDDLYEVFLSILKVHGFTAVKKDGVTKIVPEMLAKQDAAPTMAPGSLRTGEEIVTGVIPVHFVSAAELVPILRPLLPQDSHMAATIGTNVLIVADSAANVKRMVEIVSKLDLDTTHGIDVVRLDYATATDVAQLLETLTTKARGANPPAGEAQAAFAADERTNSILLAGSPQMKLRYRALISSLDTPAGETEAIKVVYLKYATAEDLVAVLQEVISGQSTPSMSGSMAPQGGQIRQRRPLQIALGGNAGGGFGDVRVTADEATNALIVQGPPRDVKRVLEVVTQLDVRRAQVLVEGIVAEVSASQDDELGIQWKTNLPDTGIVGGTRFPGSVAGGIDSPFDPDDGPDFLTGLTLGYLSGGDLRGLIRALAGNQYTNVLSTPSLMTLDNAEAEIVVGQNVPFVTGQFSNSTTTPDNPFQTIQRQDVGIKLRVKPQINEGDTVTMEIEQEVSSVDESTVGADLITNKRSIKTNVQVDNGEIVVLGGLIGDDARANQDKVPLLGDIPLVGNLFKNSRRSNSKTNLMVFLRPQIVRNRETAADLSSARYEDIRAKQRLQNATQTEILLPQRGPVLPGIVE